MIWESGPWKDDLYYYIEQIENFNSAQYFDDDNAYTIVEKAIFYSAFIIRKLSDCKGKLSDEAEKYSLKIYPVKPLKQVDFWHRWISDDSHDWENEKKITVAGRNICNWLIHSYIFSVVYNEDNVIDNFFVCSDRYRNKNLYRIPMCEWVKYMKYIASDDIVRMSTHYDPQELDHIFDRKERNKGEYI